MLTTSITITTDDEKLRKEVLSGINAKLKLDDRGVIKSFLGMSFEYNAKKLYWHITQGTYIKDLCKTMDLTQRSSRLGARRRARPRARPSGCV
jgi:hypothetical protein